MLLSTVRIIVVSVEEDEGVVGLGATQGDSRRELSEGKSSVTIAIDDDES